MNKYEAKIKGMHCDACKILISEELEEKELQNIKINLEKGIVNFNSSKSLDKVETILKVIFHNLNQYSLINIKVLTLI